MHAPFPHLESVEILCRNKSELCVFLRGSFGSRIFVFGGISVKERIKRLSIILCIAMVLSIFSFPTVLAADDTKMIKVLKGAENAESHKLSNNFYKSDKEGSDRTYEE